MYNVELAEHAWLNITQEDIKDIGSPLSELVKKDKEHLLCIERKESVAELAGNCGEKRFLRELKAMASFPHAFLLLEFDWHDIEQYPVGSRVPESKWSKIRIKGKYIMRVLSSAMVEHGIKVIACGNKKRAEETAFRIMRTVNDHYVQR